MKLVDSALEGIAGVVTYHKCQNHSLHWEVG